VRLRLEALMSGGPPDDPGSRVIADWAATNLPAWQTSAANGVGFSVASEADGAAPPWAVLTATNAGVVPRHAAWGQCRRRFASPLDLKDRQALGVWIEGDGQGELVAIRLESPQHIAFGAVADRYVTVDFTGRRYFTLVETESARWSDSTWNDAKGLYNVYRETINFGTVESVSLWLQNLPPGKEAKCRVGPVQAIPMLPAVVKNPTVSVNGVTLVLPAELPVGRWIEGSGPEDCVLYGSKGEQLRKVIPGGAWPVLRPGPNELRFTSERSGGPSPRARITVFSRGEPIASASGG
jgi:hypothetical protein